MAKTLRIYLSAPMRGVEDENRPLFAEWAERLRVCGFTVHSPPETEDHVTRCLARGKPRAYTATIREWMAEDMRLICMKTDAVLVLDRRAIHGPTIRSRGVYAEVSVAAAVGVPVLILDEHFTAPTVSVTDPAGNRARAHENQQHDQRGAEGPRDPGHGGEVMANLETMRAAMPSPVYGCACEGCDCEVSWPAEDLQWHDGREEVETDDVLLHRRRPRLLLRDLQQRSGA